MHKGQRHHPNPACGIRCGHPTRVSTGPDPDGRQTPWLYTATHSGEQGTRLGSLGEPMGSRGGVRGVVGSSGDTGRPVPRPGSGGPASTAGLAGLTRDAASAPRSGLRARPPACGGRRADPHSAGAPSPTREVTAGDTCAAAAPAHCPGPRMSRVRGVSQPPRRGLAARTSSCMLTPLRPPLLVPENHGSSVNLFFRRAVSLRP